HANPINITSTPTPTTTTSSTTTASNKASRNARSSSSQSAKATSPDNQSSSNAANGPINSIIHHGVSIPLPYRLTLIPQADTTTKRPTLYDTLTDSINAIQPTIDEYVQLGSTSASTSSSTTSTSGFHNYMLTNDVHN